MNLLGQSYDTVLEHFLQSAPLHRLAVLKADSSLQEDKALNVGRALAEAIKSFDRHDERMFQFTVQEEVYKIIKEHTFIDPKLGDTVILENLGILFEPTLRINVTELLNRISRNTLTILLWPGAISSSRLFFLSPTSKLFIKQSETNYITL